MIGFIKGVVVSLSENFALVENNGIGYEIYVSTKTMDKLKVGAQVELFTFLDVKEDSLNLFGFGSSEEKNLFLKLTSVSGVGCKVAIAILSGLSVSEICSAIVSADIATITRVKGIGKKTAERLILELKDKVSGEVTVISPDKSAGGYDDAVAALSTLGFTRNEATLMVAKVTNKEGMTLEQIIMAALKNN